MKKHVFGLSLLLTSVVQAQPEKVVIHNNGKVEIVQHDPPLSKALAERIGSVPIYTELGDGSVVEGVLFGTKYKEGIVKDISPGAVVRSEDGSWSVIDSIVGSEYVELLYSAGDKIPFSENITVVNFQRDFQRDMMTHERGGPYIGFTYDHTHAPTRYKLNMFEIKSSLTEAVGIYNDIIHRAFSQPIQLNVRWSDPNSSAPMSPFEIAAATRNLLCFSEPNSIRNQFVQSYDSIGLDKDTFEDALMDSATFPEGLTKFRAYKTGGVSSDFIPNKIYITHGTNSALDWQAVPAPMEIVLNSGFIGNRFQLDRSKPITASQIDLVTVFVHEIAHSLGFVSMAERNDYRWLPLLPDSERGMTLWDYYRLPASEVNVSGGDFKSFTREMRIGSSANAVQGLGSAWLSPLSTGSVPGATGHQASHWLSTALNGDSYVGILAPAYQSILDGRYLQNTDIRAIDLLGYTIDYSTASIPPVISVEVSPVGDLMHDPSLDLVITWIQDPDAFQTDVLIFDLGDTSIGSSIPSYDSLVFRSNNISSSSITVAPNEISLIPGHRYQWHAAVYTPQGHTLTPPATFIAAGSVGPVGPCTDQFESARLLPIGVASEGMYAAKSVDIDGDIAVVGNPSKSEDGRAYVYRRDGSRWIEEAILTPSDSNASISLDYFGASVSVDGNTVVVGAFEAGTAFVFRYDGANWVQEQQLYPSDPISFNWFGHSVSVSGDRVVVGAPYADGVVDTSGAAYIFDYENTSSSWTEATKATAADGDTDLFGYSVEVSGDDVVIGAPEDDDLAANGGSAYIFNWDGIIWSHQAKLLPTDGTSLAKDRFGHSVSIDNDVVAIGAYGTADQYQYTAITPGKVYAFRNANSVWTQEANLQPAVAVNDDGFGISVSISDDVIVAGAAFMDGFNGTDTGSVFAFQFKGGSWIERNRMQKSVGGALDWYGSSVGISGDTIIGGAPLDLAYQGFRGSAFIHEFNSCPVDLFKDGVLNFFDVSEFLQQYSGQTEIGDWNCDGVVNPFDVLKFNNDFGAGCP